MISKWTVCTIKDGNPDLTQEHSPNTSVVIEGSS